MLEIICEDHRMVPGVKLVMMVMAILSIYMHTVFSLILYFKYHVTLNLH